MRTKRKGLLLLLTVVSAVCISIGVGGIMPAAASETTIGTDTLLSNFTAVGGNGLIDYVNDVSYGSFTNTNFSGSGIIVETQNKADDGGWLINFPAVKYGAGVKFNGVVDISDNTASDTLIELAFLGANDQAKGIKINIEDAYNPNKYITLFIWHAYANADAVGSKAWMGAAAGTWETGSANIIINDTGFDTEDYDDSYGAGFYPVGNQVDKSGSSAGNGEGCFLNYAEDGHAKANPEIKLNSNSAASVKVQFDNAEGKLFINGVRVRDFKNYSADGENFFDGFTDGKVKLSVGVIRSNKGSGDDYAKFCIMNIDGNSIVADENGDVQLNGIEGLYDGTEQTVDAADVVGKFSKVGEMEGYEIDDLVRSVSYGNFGTTYLSGSGVMVETRNKAEDKVEVFDGAPFNDLSSVRYAPGVKLDTAIDISDNTASDTLIELVFPGVNDNWQARGIKIVIEDATDAGKNIAIFLLSSWANGDKTGGGVAVAAAGTWEKTILGPDVYIQEAAFDTEDYDDGQGTARLVKVGDAYNDDMGEGDYEGCFLNLAEHGHIKAETQLARTSKNTLKVQFDYENGVLLVNGVHIRDFKKYSVNGENFFDGFTDGKVKVSVGILRSVKKSTDEFTRFCITNIDGISLQKIGYGTLADKVLVEYTYAAPASALIEVGNTEIPAPVAHNLFAGDKETDKAFTVNITAPSGNLTENYSDANFDFNEVGTYEIEYFVDGESVGTANFKTALKGDDNELAEIESFDLKDDLYFGKTITLSDFVLKTDKTVEIETATVTVYKDGVKISEPMDADSEWEYTLGSTGEYTFVVTSDDFSLKTSANVLHAIMPSEEIQHGTVVISGVGSAAALRVGANGFVITAAAGYEFKSLTVAGVDVTEEVFGGEYTYTAEEVTGEVYYTVVFEKLPDVTVVFTADGETVATLNDVENGSLFGEIEKPTIPEKAHYNAIGWNKADDFVITENLTVEAVYEPKTYTITFDTDGGTEIDAKQFTSIETVVAPEEVPEKTGYTFDAWYNGSEKFVFGGTLTSDITLTAKYTVKKFSVTVKSEAFADIAFEVEYDTAFDAEKVSARSGYEFKGLFTNEELTNAYNGEKITEDTVLYAAYEAKASGCGASVSGIGAEVLALTTLAMAVCLIVLKGKKSKKN